MKQNSDGEGLRGRWTAKDWWALAALALLTIAVWAPVLFLRDRSFGIEVDFLRQFYPARYFTVESLRTGSLPLWNPYVLSGTPFLASYQSALFYPPNLLMVGLYAISGATYSLKAQVAFVVFHFFLAGAFTYLLCRELRLKRYAAIIASIAYMLCGYMIAHAGHLNQQSAAAWIPLIFFFFYRALMRRRLSNAVAGGVALGIALLAGHLQPLFYAGLFLFAFLLFEAFWMRRGDDSLPGFWYGLGALGLMAGIALVLSAVQLWPTIEYIRLSTRQAIPFAHAGEYSLPAKQVVTIIFPHFYGTGVEGASYFGRWAFWEVYGYTGITALALAVVSLRRGDKRLPVFLGIVAGLSLLLALGPQGFLYTVFFKLGLGFNRMRDPARILVIFGFSIAMMAGMGADHILESFRGSGPEADRRFKGISRTLVGFTIAVLVIALIALIYLLTRDPTVRPNRRLSIESMVLPVVFLVVMVSAVLLARKGRKLRRALPVLLIAIVLADLVVLNVTTVDVKIDTDDVYGDREVSEYLEGIPGYFRVEPDAYTMYESLDNGAIYGIQKATGDDSLIVEDYYRYRELITPSISPGVQMGLFYSEGINSPLLDVGNVKYFISRNRIDPVVSSEKLEYLGQKGGVHVYLNTGVMPRAWLAPGVREVRDKEEAYRSVADDPSTLKDVAVVVAESGTVPDSSVPRLEEVAVKEYSEHTISLDVPEDAEGLLVLSEVMYPGWEAFVDGEKVDILRTDYLFRGIILEGGQEEVVLKFRPKSVKLGAVVSMTALVLVFLYALWIYFKRLRSPVRAPEGGEE